MAEDLFVCDVDYDLLACKIEDFWETEDNIMEEIIAILSKVETQGISMGKAHDSLSIIIEAIKINYYNSKGQGKAISKKVLEFLTRIDEIDLKLYGG